MYTEYKIIWHKKKTHHLWKQTVLSMIYRAEISICISIGFAPAAACKPESKPNQSGGTIREHRTAHN